MKKIIVESKKDYYEKLEPLNIRNRNTIEDEEPIEYPCFVVYTLENAHIEIEKVYESDFVEYYTTKDIIETEIEEPLSTTEVPKKDPEDNKNAQKIDALADPFGELLEELINKRNQMVQEPLRVKLPKPELEEDKPLKKRPSVKVGDIVTIKDENWYKLNKDQFGSIYGGIREEPFVSGMALYCGEQKVVRDIRIKNGVEYIFLEGIPFSWHTWMFK